MTRASRRLGLWAGAILITATGLVGIAQASWNDQLDLSGTITTGSVEASWFSASCDDNQSSSVDVASWDATPDPADPTGNLLIAIDGGYPTYELDCELYLANTGGLPVTVSSANASNPNPGAASVTASKSGDGATLQPCRSMPSWGSSTGSVPANCRQTIHVVVEIGEDVQAGDELQFSVQVTAELAA